MLSNSTVVPDAPKELKVDSNGSRVVVVSWKAGFDASSETQGQLVGTTGFSWAKVYNKSGKAPG